MRAIRIAGWVALGMVAIATAKTIWDFNAPEEGFRKIHAQHQFVQVTDRQGKPLSVSYQNRWNLYDTVALHEVPEPMLHAFVLAEDKRFYAHGGVDWRARASALWQRLRHGNRSRGASTISEQVVRMLHPRPRHYWSKWIEGLEAASLERDISKTEILEFYLNQVPYASNRRGVVQAARHYFGRDLETLSTKEMLALGVLVRAPSRFDLYAGQVGIENAIGRLAKALQAHGVLTAEMVQDVQSQKLMLSSSDLPVDAFHFVNAVRNHALGSSTAAIRTTLDATLQIQVNELLEQRLQALRQREMTQAAALVVDHTTQEILAWVSLGADCAKTQYKADGCKLDMVREPRQPGSALKPFLYAAALDKGWNAATVLQDTPYSDSVGQGLHHFRNYSRHYYGAVSLRQALGNSLNIPAVRTVHYVTPETYLAKLHRLGFASLDKPADFYDEGLALGNGEVSLFELVQAYAALAQRGMFRPLRLTAEQPRLVSPVAVYSPEAASLIGDILSDPWARQLEFGRSSVLNLPVQTAVKTGTSTDYRDAWAVGYNHRYAVGVWMGNADYTPTDGITGSLGPALALRGIFNALNQQAETAPLYLSPKLVMRDICVDTAADETVCPTYSEYFMPHAEREREVARAEPVKIFRPSEGLQMAFDPRIPPEKQAFEMRVLGAKEGDAVEWFINSKAAAKKRGKTYLWPTRRGKHQVQAVLWRNGQRFAETETVRFVVK